MGKGDRRTRKGKIYAGSFGKARPQRKAKKGGPAAAPAAPAAPAAKPKAPAKE